MCQHLTTNTDLWKLAHTHNQTHDCQYLHWECNDSKTTKYSYHRARISLWPLPNRNKAGLTKKLTAAPVSGRKKEKGKGKKLWERKTRLSGQEDLRCSQHPYDGSRPFITPPPGEQTPLWHPRASGIHVVHTHVHTHTGKMLIRVRIATVVVHTFNPRGNRWISVNSKLARATQWDPLSKNNIEVFWKRSHTLHTYTAKQVSYTTK